MRQLLQFYLGVWEVMLWDGIRAVVTNLFLKGKREGLSRDGVWWHWAMLWAGGQE